MQRLVTFFIAIILGGIGLGIVYFYPVIFGGDDSSSYIATESISTGGRAYWNGVRTKSPAMIFDEDKQIFKMWYVGNGVLERSGIGYAESNNGVQYNEKENTDAILTPEKDWEIGGLKSVAVVQIGDTYHLWYSAVDALEGGIERIGYATSKDGVRWIKHSQNPILVPGGEGSWDGSRVSEPMVITDGATFHMWYSGGSEEAGTSAIGYATSTNGRDWVESNNNPVFRGVQKWDEEGVGGPFVIEQVRDALYEMWFHGYNKDGYASLGRAYSEDREVWVPDVDYNPIVFSKKTSYLDPHVVQVNDLYYLWMERRYERSDAVADSIEFTAWPLESAEATSPVPTEVPLRKKINTQ